MPSFIVFYFLNSFLFCKMELFHRKHAEDKSENVKPSDNIKPFYIIIFSNGAKPETVSWIIDLLTRTQHEGGAELRVHVTHTAKEVNWVFFK